MVISTPSRHTWCDLIHPTELVQRIELHDRGADRRHRLVVCACARHTSQLLTDERSWRALEVAEQFADGQASLEALWHAHAETAHTLKLLSLQQSADLLSTWTRKREHALEAARHVARLTWLATLPEAIGHAEAMIAAEHARQALAWMGQEDDLYLAVLYDDLTAPQTACLEPAWLCWNDDTVLRLAQRSEAERCFSTLPILADALEEAGCDQAHILEHCRSSGPHIKGCWVIDLILAHGRNAVLA